ncbi:MAG: hypothetical protein JST84_21870 [Acidobacteria bacterium]|nr:hypothetical protein [Acidobacteriota bacterium]
METGTIINQYTLAINPADTSYVQITMRVRNLPQTFHLAMRHRKNQIWQNPHAQCFAW